ncbi:MAG: hypothetical protein L3J51_05800 [Cocleimonas sp.]|nr:hypothetical protein [Cocleimonas sp.]
MSEKKEFSGTNNSNHLGSRCEQCGGQMQATTAADKHDNIMECLYCGHIVDAPDGFYSQETDFFNDANGKISKQKTTTITYQVNDPIDLGNLNVFKDDFFDGAFSSLMEHHNSIGSQFESRILNHMESTNHSSIDFLDDNTSENNEKHVKKSSSFSVISEGSFKETSNSYSSNKTIHTIMSNEGVSETSDNSSLGLWVVIGILVLVIILGLLFLL